MKISNITDLTHQYFCGETCVEQGTNSEHRSKRKRNAILKHTNNIFYNFHTVQNTFLINTTTTPTILHTTTPNTTDIPTKT